MIRAQLTRNLRRSVLRGHPWIYREAIQIKKGNPDECLAELSDSKGKFLAWCLFDDSSPLALRVLSLEKKPPREKDLESLVDLAVARRQKVFDRKQTNAFRMINGEGDRLPGLVFDLYDQVGVIQFDGPGAEKFWSQYPIQEWLLKKASIKTLVNKTRGREPKVEGSLQEEWVPILENGIRFVVDVVKGQKTGFFLDQRENRQYVRSLSQDFSVMNLFSYTGGFSVYAGCGQAREVLSVDLAKPALEMAEQNWKLNNLPNSDHQTLDVDIFQFLETENKKLWDVVIVDPPSMAHSEKQKSGAIQKYTSLFSQAARQVKNNGHLILSSCSSHISFDDFFDIATESLSQASRRGLVMRVSGQGNDHPFPHILPEMRYLKFMHIQL